jgi:CheY-like chemotaxis protein
MALSTASLADLVAELRERLRPFMSAADERLAAREGEADRSSEEPAAQQPGPLGPAGRASLAARLLAVVLGDRRDRTSRQMGQALEHLAATLAATPAPLCGSALEGGLGRLALELEQLARVWDRKIDADLCEAWRSLREVGDGLWPPPGGEVVGSAQKDAARPPREPRRSGVLWLLVAGRLRGQTLRRRLEAAGWSVACLSDPASAVVRLDEERPTAIICDDAAPARHHSRLRRLLPSAAPPVITVRGRRQTAAADARGGPDDLVWLPPFSPGDLAARIGRHGK